MLNILFCHLFQFGRMSSLMLKTANSLPMYDTFQSTQKLPLLKQQQELLEMAKNDDEKHQDINYNQNTRSKTRYLGINQKLADDSSVIEFRLIE